jgi:GTP-binding protein YchF
MRTGIIGFSQVGKTSFFKILTRHSSDSRHPHGANIGVAKVPDERLDRLAALFNPKKLIHASLDYLDTSALTAESLRSPAFIAELRSVDCLAHVLRVFASPIQPLEDLKKVEFEMIISDLAQVEKRLDKLEKDLKKLKNPEFEKEFFLLKKAKAHLEKELPLREMEMSPEEKKRLRGFMFLSEKPILYVLNLPESNASKLDEAAEKYGLSGFASKPGAAVSAVCGKMEAELAEMSDEEAREFLEGFGLKESGLARMVRKTYELLGLISFFTVGEDECRAWTIPRGSKAVEAAGAIHSDLAKHFIRAETIRWDALLEAGSESVARAKGLLRLEGKDYVVQDGDVLHIRHSG